jgi:Holliday junction DNA helicase RuvA
MIALLTGRVHEKRGASAVIDVGGVGYELAMSTGSLAALPAEGDTVTVHTRLHVRDDVVALYGFESVDEKDLFEMLIGVSGIGPKVALAALSALAPASLREAIAREDAALIATTPGIGKKTAQRMIVELKDRLELPDLSQAGESVSAGAYAEATEALAGMGFSRAEVAEALSDAGDASSSAEDLVRSALKRLGGVS